VTEPLILYGTSACHLCDQAKDLLAEASVAYAWADIAGDNALLERYSLRIPVLFCPSSGQELGWPFDRSSLEKFLETPE